MSYASYNDNSSNFGSNTVNYPLNQFNETYGGTLYARKYFLYANKIGFRAGPYINYFRGTNKNTYINGNSVNEVISKSNDYQAGVNLALVYYPSRHLGVSATIFNFDYEHYDGNTVNQEGESDNGNAVNFNFISKGIQLSLFYVFGNK